MDRAYRLLDDPQRAGSIQWRRGQPSIEEDREGPARWLVPGLVNAHTHVGDTALRNVTGKPHDVASLVGPGGWKHQQLQELDAAPLQAGVQSIAAEMAADGVVGFLDFREGGRAGLEVVAELKLPVAPSWFVRPAGDADGSKGGTSQQFAIDELLRRPDVAGLGLSGLRDLPTELLDDCADAARRAGKPLAIHLSEDVRDDVDAALALEPRFVVHACRATRRDLQALADANVSVVVCPRSNAYFGHAPPTHDLLAVQADVALGTDNGMLQDGRLRAEAAWLRQHHRVDKLTLLQWLVAGRQLMATPSGGPWFALPEDPFAAGAPEQTHG